MHGQSYWFDASVGREVYLAPDEQGQRESLRLRMNGNNLGWYWMEEITDPSVIQQLLADAGAVVITPPVLGITLAVPQQPWSVWTVAPGVLLTAPAARSNDQDKKQAGMFDKGASSTHGAYRNTITYGADGQETTAASYSYQAPRFVKNDDRGEQLACKPSIEFQGRIDSPRQYGGLDFMMAVLEETLMWEHGTWPEVLGQKVIIDKEERTVSLDCPSILVATGGTCEW